MNKISVGACIRFGWETLKKRPLLVIGATIIAFGINSVVSSILSPDDNAPMSAAIVVMSLMGGAIGMLIELGLLHFTLRAHDAIERAKLDDLWHPQPFLYFIAGQILVGLIVIVGLLLLVVPGVIALLGLLFTSYLIVDKGRGPIEALKESWAITKGHKLDLFVLVLALVGLNVLGLLALVVGLLVTIPVSMLAMVHAYRTLQPISSGNTLAPAHSTVATH